MTKLAKLEPELSRALAKAARRIEQADRRADQARQDRDKLIRQAVEDGASLRAVGAAAGVSHEAVRRLTQRKGA
jgi:hypothetical protein